MKRIKPSSSTLGIGEDIQGGPRLVYLIMMGVDLKNNFSQFLRFNVRLDLLDFKLDLFLYRLDLF